MRMGKWVGIDGKKYANTTYISEFHPHIATGMIFQQKNACRPAAAGFRRRPAALFLQSFRLGCGHGIRRCRLCSHILCHQFQPIFRAFSLKINQVLLESTQHLKKPTTLKTNFPSSDRRGQPKSDLLPAVNEQGPYW